MIFQFRSSNHSISIEIVLPVSFDRSHLAATEFRPAIAYIAEKECGIEKNRKITILNIQKTFANTYFCAHVMMTLSIWCLRITFHFWCQFYVVHIQKHIQIIAHVVSHNWLSLNSQIKRKKVGLDCLVSVFVLLLHIQ